MTTYHQGDPRQKIQYCIECGDPTDRCEDDLIFIEVAGFTVGPLCIGCSEPSEQPEKEGE
jgi:hypothetical protein